MSGDTSPTLVQPRTSWWLFQLYADEHHSQVSDLFIIGADTDSNAMRKGFDLLNRYGLPGIAQHHAAKIFPGRLRDFKDAFYSVKPYDLHVLLEVLFYSNNQASHLTLVERHAFARHIRSLLINPQE